MLFSRNKFEFDAGFVAEDTDRDLLALIDSAHTDEDVRRVARLCMQRSRARIDAARAGAR